MEVHLKRSFTQKHEIEGGNVIRPAWKTVIELRSRRGWTQEKLAEKSILSVRTIQNLERGKFTHRGTVAKVADALGVPVSQCITGEDKFANSAVVSDVPPCPYRGLHPFREEDADLFFGRESLVEILREKVIRRSITQVSGCSGSGKSSLVAAGLIPALKRSSSWLVISCRPGSDPFGTLASALIPNLEPVKDEISRAADLPRLRTVLEQGQLSYLLAQILSKQNESGLLLFIDQFEELYTLCASQAVRERFLGALVSLGSFASNIKVVYTVRADFTSRLLVHRRFVDEMQDSDVKVGPMNRDELEAAICKPASQLNVRFEDGLAERILSDAGAEAGLLPLLEFALSELWARQVDKTLTHSGYERIGQLSGAIANRAEKLYRSFSSRQQEAVHHILTRLVRPAEDGGEDTRQRIPVTALFSEELLNSDSGRQALGVLAGARLVAVGVESGARQQMVEITHEALVRRWPRLTQWLQEDREILVWRQRIRLLIREWELTGRDDGFLLRGPLLDEARLWLSRRANDLTPVEKDFIGCSLALWHRQRTRHPIAKFETLVEIPPAGRLRADGSHAFLARPGLVRIQINVIPVPESQRQAVQTRLPQVPFEMAAPMLSSALVMKDEEEDAVGAQAIVQTGQNLDDQTFSLLRDLQIRGSSGLALELLNPQLDGISNPDMRLKFASIIFDMMHIRGRYSDAAELIRQELAVHPHNGEIRSPALMPLKIRLLHHQMFYRPVNELWTQMLDLLACSDSDQDPESHGEVLFMLGGNLGTLRGHYREARQFLKRATRHAKQRRDHYLLTRCLRKYADYLRHQGHLRLGKAALLEALRLSAHGRGTRQRIYILGCLGDLERQQQNYSSAQEYFERAIELARSTFIPGWLGNLNLGLAELAISRRAFAEAKVFLAQAEAHYRSTHPRHWWGEIQVGLGTVRLMRAANHHGWEERAHSIREDAKSAGYARDADFAASLLNDQPHRENVLMFL